MSNPGVISLASNPKYGLKIEDNIGEAIHIHYENIRLDLTVEEFENLANCMNDVIDGIVDVENFSSHNINSNDLVDISSFLPKLLKVEKDEISMNELFVNSNCGKYIPLKKIKKTDITEVCSQQEQIILFGSTNYVICGQEQCMNLHKSQENIKIPVTRLFFDKTVKIKDFQKKEQIKLFIKKFIKIIKWILRKLKSFFS